MKSKFLLLLFLFAGITKAQGSPPDWSVSPELYQFNANMIAVVQLNNQPVLSGQNMVGVFSGNEVRGVATPQLVGGQQVYFITLYSNQAGEELSLKGYIAAQNIVLAAANGITFQPNAVYGSVQNPSVINLYSGFNLPPVLTGIPDQTIPFDGSFMPILLMNFASDPEGDSLSFSYSGADYLNVLIDNNGTATITALQGGFTGVDTIIFRATEVGSGGLWDEDTVVFKVLPNDTPPRLNGIPSQRIGSNSNFQSFNLNEYLIENDGDAVSFSASFAAQEIADPLPQWNINPAQYQFTMTLVAEISSLGKPGGTTAGMLAAFNGDELRGFTSPTEFAGKYLYFLTIYSNTSGDSIRLKFYDNEAQRLVPVNTSFIFIQNSAIGTPVNPSLCSAGNIIFNIAAGGEVSLTVPDRQWRGTEKIIFKVTDVNTANAYSDTAHASFSVVQDRAPLLNGVQNQTINRGELFKSFDLDDYLIELDGDAVRYSRSGAVNLQVDIYSGNIVTITAPQLWTGEESIIFRVTDFTTNQLFSEVTVVYKVLPVDNPPELAEIPGQTIGANGQFSAVNLNNYLTELDNDSVQFNYTFAPKPPDLVPNWTVNASQFELTMNLVADVSAFGKTTNKMTGKLSAWKGDELRGEGAPVLFAGKIIYYMTMYANTNGDTLRFRYYDPGTQRILPVLGMIVFQQNANVGSPSQPYPLRAGTIVADINSAATASFELSDRSWHGSETITFHVKDVNTLHQYGDSTSAVFTVLMDRVPVLTGIQDQITTAGGEFVEFDLDNYLQELDGDTVDFTSSGQSQLQVSIMPGNIVRVSSHNIDFTGTEYIRFRAVDRTAQGLYSEDTVSFTVLPADHPPLAGNIPDQSIGLNGTFNAFDLDSYLTELDGDSVEWSYAILPPDTADVMPAWVVNPGNFELTMNVIAKVRSVGIYHQQSGHLLGAFAGNELRGTATSITVGQNQLYFLTMYANTAGEQISFRFYDTVNNKTYPVKQKVQFISNGVIGSVNNPQILEAGFILIDFGTDNLIRVHRTDEQWSGTEKVKFSVRDVNTFNGYSTSKIVSFRVLNQVIQPVEAPTALTTLPLRRPLRVRLNWNDNSSNESVFIIERKAGDSLQSSAYTALDTVSAGLTSFEDETVEDTTIYTYRLYAVNSQTASNFSNQSTVKSLYTIIPVTAPTITLVANVEPGAVIVSWNDAANNETGYRVYRKNGDTASVQSYTLVRELPANTTIFIDTTVQFATMHTYKTAAFKSDTTSDFSNQVSIYTFPQIPVIPQQVFPANNSAGVMQPLTFKWLSSDRAERYIFALAQDSLFQSMVRLDSAVTDTHLTVNGLQNLTPYYWRIEAVNIGGYSGLSNVFTFKTLGNASGIMPLIPEYNAVNIQTDSIKFFWTKSVDLTKSGRTITGYWFELFTDTVAAAVLRDTALTDTFRTVTNLTHFTGYYWRVRAKNELGWNAFSPYFTFRTIVPNPQIPVLATPYNGVLNTPLSFYIKWKKGQFTETYHLQTAKDSGFTQLVVNDTMLTDTLKLLQNLTDGTAYFWRVKGKNIAGESGFSSPWKFVSKMNAPDSLQIESIPGRVALLQWRDRSSNEANYRVERKAGDAVSAGSYTQIALLNANVSSYRDSVAGDTLVYTYRVQAVNNYTTSTFSNAATTTLVTLITEDMLPAEYALEQNYPNPFNPSTRISYSIKESGHTSIILYDMLGSVVRVVVNKEQEAGRYTIQLDANRLTSGVYIYGIRVNNYTQYRKLTLLK